MITAKSIGYHEERCAFPELSEHISSEKAEKIVKKLARHFKIGRIFLYFRGRWDSGRAWRFGHRIRLCKNPSLYVICHEVAHFTYWKRWGRTKRTHGTKKWMTQVKRVIAYGQKKNFWRD